MSLNSFLSLARRSTTFRMKRYLHDRKLPQVLNNFFDNNDKKTIGIESPRRMDQNSYREPYAQDPSKDINSREHKKWNTRIYVNQESMKDPFNDRED